MSKNQPVYILPEGVQRTLGREAQRMNIMAAKLVAQTVRTTLGPKGMDKMLVDSMGDVVVTNDGVTILDEMQIEHPAAKMIVEIAKTQDSEVGDGTTTVAILAGELLNNAENLLNKEVHPTIISKGYKLASNKALEVLEKISKKISKSDTKLLMNVAVTAMTGKGAEISKEVLASIATKAINQVIDDSGGLDMDNIKIEKKVGLCVEDSELIQGVVLDKERVSSSMPLIVKDAKIALIDSPLEIKSTEIDAKIQITDPTQMQAFVEQEERLLKDMADKIIKSGANVVFSQKGIDDLVSHFLSKAGIYACRRIKKSDMDKLSRATNAKIVSSVKDLSPNDLGKAGFVEEVKLGDEEMTYVKNCVNPKAVTIMIRGGSKHIVDEVERAMKDALGVLTASIKIGKVLPGAGAPEIEVSKELRKFANTLSGREQLAVLSYADAIEVVPITLAENAGLDPIDTLTEIKSEHEKGKVSAGIDVFTGKIVDAWDAGVVEPLKVKTQAIRSATEVTELILRIDDVIAASNLSKSGTGSEMPHSGMM